MAINSVSLPKDFSLDKIVRKCMYADNVVTINFIPVLKRVVTVVCLHDKIKIKVLLR